MIYGYLRPKKIIKSVDLMFNKPHNVLNPTFGTSTGVTIL